MAIVSSVKSSPQEPIYTLPPHRFWDETVRVPGLFDKCRMADDYPNAIACFDRMARHRFWDLSHSPDFVSTKPSIVAAFQPKSGGTFLYNRMLELGYQEFGWCFPHRLCHSHCYVGIDALELYMSGGCTSHAHFRPEPSILAALDRAGVTKIWVHLRNPAESAISSYYHYLGQGHGEGALGEQRRQEALSEAGRQGLAPGMELSEFVVDTIGWYVDWVAQWLQFAKRHPELVVLTYFSELANPQELFSRVFYKMGVDLIPTVTSDPKPQDRFRSKRSSDWRSELTLEARTYVEQRILADLEGYPQLARLWT